MKPVENTQKGTVELTVSNVLEHNHWFKFIINGMEELRAYKKSLY